MSCCGRLLISLPLASLLLLSSSPSSSSPPSYDSLNAVTSRPRLPLLLAFFFFSFKMKCREEELTAGRRRRRRRFIIESERRKRSECRDNPKPPAAAGRTPKRRTSEEAQRLVHATGPTVSSFFMFFYFFILFYFQGEEERLHLWLPRSRRRFLAAAADVDQRPLQHYLIRRENKSPSSPFPQKVFVSSSFTNIFFFLFSVWPRRKANEKSLGLDRRLSPARGSR